MFASRAKYCAGQITTAVIGTASSGNRDSRSLDIGLPSVFRQCNRTEYHRKDRDGMETVLTPGRRLQEMPGNIRDIFEEMVPRDSVQQFKKFNRLERGGAENFIAAFLGLFRALPHRYPAAARVLDSTDRRNRGCSAI
jgi:hypothetical protein